jgi:NADH-quinone oxidoreductase subunit J
LIFTRKPFYLRLYASMLEALFYVFAVLTLVPALLLVTSRNAVNGAMFMIVSFVGTAALYGLLQAYLLAILQVLVYAGAVVVLFLFIIMLLDVERPTARKVRALSLGASVAALCLMVVGVVAVVWSGRGGAAPALGVDAPASVAARFGYELFTRYMLPFQWTGFLLLAAMIGVIFISKKTQAAAVAGAPAQRAGTARAEPAPVER